MTHLRDNEREIIVANVLKAADASADEFESIVITDDVLNGRSVYKIVSTSKLGGTYTDWADCKTLEIL